MAKLDMDNPLFSNNGEPTEKNPVGRPRNKNIVRNEDGGNSVQEGLSPDRVRFSLICDIDKRDFVRDYAYTKRLTITETMNTIIGKFMKDYYKNPKNEELLKRRR